MSLRNRIEAKEKSVPFFVEAWDVTVYLRSLSLADRLEMSDLFDKSNPMQRIAILVARSTHDEDGKRVFSDDDAPAILGMSGDAIASIARESRKLSRIDQTSVELGDAKKGLPTILAADSPSV